MSGDRTSLALMSLRAHEGAGAGSRNWRSSLKLKFQERLCRRWPAGMVCMQACCSDGGVTLEPRRTRRRIAWLCRRYRERRLHRHNTSYPSCSRRRKHRRPRSPASSRSSSLAGAQCALVPTSTRPHSCASSRRWRPADDPGSGADHRQWRCARVAGNRAHRYAEAASLKLKPAKIEIEQLDPPLILAFLEHLENKRGNTARTRNARLAAINAFFRFLEYRVPSCLDQSCRIHAIPMKKTQSSDRRPPQPRGAAGFARRAGSNNLFRYPGQSHAAPHLRRWHARLGAG